MSTLYTSGIVVEYEEGTPFEEVDRIATAVRYAEDGETLSAAAMVRLFPEEPERHKKHTLAAALAYFGAFVVERERT